MFKNTAICAQAISFDREVWRSFWASNPRSKFDAVCWQQDHVNCVPIFWFFSSKSL